MFKSSRWRSDKNKIKALFKLQFQATQVPEIGWDNLWVSLIPLETGKVAVRTVKTIVQNGICSWETPVYQTVKLMKEPKTGKFEDKIYHFLVSNGSSKAGFLGEVSINFADYVEAFKPSSVSLPLKNSNSSTVLNVKIQRLPVAVDGREAGEDGNLTERSNDGRTVKSKISDPDADQSSQASDLSKNSGASESSSIMRIPKLRLPLNNMLPQHEESDSNLRASYCSDAVLASSSDNSLGSDFPHQAGLGNNIQQDAISLGSDFPHQEGLGNNIQQDALSFISSPSINASPPTSLTNGVDKDAYHKQHGRSPTECSAGAAPDRRTEDSPNSSMETTSEERLQDPEISVENPNNEIAVLARQAEVSELEMQTLRKRIVKENKRGQDLLKEICSLKEERDALQRECVRLKISQQILDNGKFSNNLRFDSDSQRCVLEEIKQELNYEKELNANLRLQLQKTQESNSELILAVRDLDELLEKKNREISFISSFNRPYINENDQEVSSGIGGSCVNSTKNCQEVQETIPEHEMEKDKEQDELEILVKSHDDAKVACSLEQKIKELYSEIVFYRKDRDDLEMQMEQIALDYEILKQENHDISSKLEQKQLQEQLNMQYDCSIPISIINDLETHVEKLEKELEKQAEVFEADLAGLISAKVDQEQRAIRAEEALRKTRWNNANTSERLQEEFKRLSKQMSSAFDANEKMAMEALTEASELRLQKNHLEDLLAKVIEELGFVKDQFEAQLLDLTNQLDSKTKQIDKLLSELEYVSKELENQKQLEDVRVGAEITKFRREIEMVMRDKNNLCEQLEEKEKLRSEMEESGKTERDALVREASLLREEAGKLLHELNNMKCQKAEKETVAVILQTEVESLRGQYTELKHSLFEDELEKENLRKQVFHLRGDLCKKEDAVTIIQKKLRDNGIPKVRISNETTKAALKHGNKSDSGHRGFKEVANLREKIKLLEGDLMMKERALENSKQTYLKKEKDLQVRIEELENERFQAYSFESQHEENLKDEKKFFAKYGLQDVIHLQETRDEQSKGLNAETPEEKIIINKNLMESGMRVEENPDQNTTDGEQLKSTKGITAMEMLKAFSGHTPDPSYIVELVSDMELLMRKNKSMEGELKEMQERYSKISLKFAEVEGERQQLTMTIRNLKQCKKN